MVAATEKVIKVQIKDIKPNPYQPESRLNFPVEVIKKMAASIQEHGLMQTPVVRKCYVAPEPKSPLACNIVYEMGDGWLRLSGYRFLVEQFGLEQYREIPVLVRELNDRQMADLVMEANTVRQDLNPIELAKLYKRYLDDFKIPQVELARRHNCSQGELNNTIRLLDLPVPIQEKIISQEITETHARQLLRLNIFPELQKDTLERTIKQSWTINELDQWIVRELWDHTKSLQPNNYGFDVKTCDNCPKRIMAADPWGDQKKQYRCPDTECWDKKQNEAEAARAAKIQEKANATTGIKKILTGNDLLYGQYETLSDGATKQLENPEQCKNCDKTALYKHHADDTYKPEWVCLNPNCFRQKKARKTREVHKIEKQQDQELTAKLGETFRSAIDHHNIAVVLALDLMLYPHFNEDGDRDMLSYFPDLPTDKKHRLDNDAIKKKLPDWSLDQLLRLCAAAVITHSRRQYAGQYNPKLEGNAKDYYAILTKTEKQLTEKLTSTPQVPSTVEKIKTEKSTIIPPGVRLAEDVSDAECKKCQLTDEDHTIGMKFQDPDKEHVFHKVCVKDWQALEPKRKNTPGFEVHVPTDKESEYRVELNGKVGKAYTLKAALVFLLEQFGMETKGTLGDAMEWVKAMNLPDEQLILDILEGKQPAEMKK